MGVDDSSLTFEKAPRRSDVYAVWNGTTFASSLQSDDQEHILLFWRGQAGEAPPGFKVNAAGTGGNRHDVPYSQIERLYSLETSCMYRGGGPFRVWKVERDESGVTWLRVQYLGDDREWALAQPGIESLPDLRRNRDPDVWGMFRFEDAEFLREDIEDLKIPRRRRSAAKKAAAKKAVSKKAG